ncbi:hypothetical protein BS47DRAFT_426115 [Hydnum rufescens UP504]|uniref:Uncharacterized protein n=1 Tax=Hydnum rufescens UP504 TaxID=1448309 RepID=A0A9P6B848_9AGAM|nr:hypothetical protein BS47DRAFT_426115 [Hydnum rufescens UP504]
MNNSTGIEPRTGMLLLPPSLPDVLPLRCRLRRDLPLVLEPEDEEEEDTDEERNSPCMLLMDDRGEHEGSTVNAEVEGEVRLVADEMAEFNDPTDAELPPDPDSDRDPESEFDRLRDTDREGGSDGSGGGGGDIGVMGILGEGVGSGTNSKSRCDLGGVGGCTLRGRRSRS